MPATSLALIRAHLNLSPDPAEDELLSHYRDAAEAWIASYIGAPITTHATATQAVLLMVGHSYACREAASPERLSSTPYGVEGMLAGLIPDPDAVFEPFHDRWPGHEDEDVTGTLTRLDRSCFVRRHGEGLDQTTSA